MADLRTNYAGPIFMNWGSDLFTPADDLVSQAEKFDRPGPTRLVIATPTDFFREARKVPGVRAWAVYAWIRTYLQTHRPESLRDTPRPGRPRVAPALTDERIQREIRRNPRGPFAASRCRSGSPAKTPSGSCSEPSTRVQGIGWFCIGPDNDRRIFRPFCVTCDDTTAVALCGCWW